MSAVLNAVNSVFLEVVEQLAFMFGDPCEVEEITTHQGDWVRATIEFSGDKKGAIALTDPSELCAEISANILGLEPDDIGDEVLARDSFKEMLNVVCGHIVPALQGEEYDFDLGLPHLEEISSEQANALADAQGSTCFDLDCSPVILGLEVHGDES